MPGGGLDRCDAKGEDRKTEIIYNDGGKPEAESLQLGFSDLLGDEREGGRERWVFGGWVLDG